MTTDKRDADTKKATTAPPTPAAYQPRQKVPPDPDILKRRAARQKVTG